MLYVSMDFRIGILNQGFNRKFSSWEFIGNSGGIGLFRAEYTSDWVALGPDRNGLGHFRAGLRASRTILDRPESSTIGNPHEELLA